MYVARRNHVRPDAFINVIFGVKTTKDYCSQLPAAKNKNDLAKIELMERKPLN